MARRGVDLLELDVEKLFEERKVEEIVEFAKLLDVEIEKKRVELRSMVGLVFKIIEFLGYYNGIIIFSDRYKDVLTASDQIKDMKKISEEIVGNIQRIADRCEFLVKESGKEVVKPEEIVM